jgi:hypothetical protein
LTLIATDGFLFPVLEAVLDLAIPDHVVGFQGFYADLAFVRRAWLSNPDHFVSCAAAVPLQRDYLANLLNALRRHQTCASRGYFVGAAGLRIGAKLGKNSYGNGDVQPPIMPAIG